MPWWQHSPQYVIIKSTNAASGVKENIIFLSCLSERHNRWKHKDIDFLSCLNHFCTKGSSTIWTGCIDLAINLIASNFLGPKSQSTHTEKGLLLMSWDALKTHISKCWMPDGFYSCQMLVLDMQSNMTPLQHYQVKTLTQMKTLSTPCIW